MAVHWGGRGPGHLSRWTRAANDNEPGSMDFSSPDNSGLLVLLMEDF